MYNNYCACNQQPTLINMVFGNLKSNIGWEFVSLASASCMRSFLFLYFYEIPFQRTLSEYDYLPVQDQTWKWSECRILGNLRHFVPESVDREAQHEKTIIIKTNVLFTYIRLCTIYIYILIAARAISLQKRTAQCTFTLLHYIL